MARILILMAILIAASPRQALAVSDSSQTSEVIAAARSFVPWKLEAYRRRDVAWSLGLQNSYFEDSILGNRTAAESWSRHEPDPQGVWLACPEGYRSGSMALQIEMDAAAPAGISLELYNRQNQLLVRMDLPALAAGTNEIELPLDLSIADSNPSSLLLTIPDGMALGISQLRLTGLCRHFGEHSFARFQLGDLELNGGERLLLR
ncbi:MAG: hypothetical protein H7A35_04060 [Planctomycetales bacterium]|nr:hypothetical protein [bacterium]UNM09230.1 MAG: hypothetical protein H7A35_04060 [Planctomycetales bacterium]